MIAAALHQGFERGHREFRRTHIDNPGLLEEGHDFSGYFTGPGLERVQVDGLLPDGQPGEEHPDRYQDEGRYEIADERSRGAVAGQFRARNVHDPVQDEEQDGHHGRRAETAFGE